jgi:hypothetical protein
LYLDPQTLTEPLDDHSDQILTVLDPMLHGVRHELADHQSGVVTPRSQCLRRDSIIQRRPRKEGGFRRSRQDYFASQRDLLRAQRQVIPQAARRQSSEHLGI